MRYNDLYKGGVIMAIPAQISAVCRSENTAAGDSGRDGSERSAGIRCFCTRKSVTRDLEEHLLAVYDPFRISRRFALLTFRANEMSKPSGRSSSAAL